MTRSCSTNRTTGCQRDRMQHIIERGLPASILVLVALLQIYLTHTANLSPWKGGGFGMFGAIDAPTMRVIQAEALDQEGHSIQLDVYSALDDRTIRRIRTLPRLSDLEQIAPRFVVSLKQEYGNDPNIHLISLISLIPDGFSPFPLLPERSTGSTPASNGSTLHSTLFLLLYGSSTVFLDIPLRVLYGLMLLSPTL